MKILGKQSLPAVPGPLCQVRILLSGHFPAGCGKYPAIPAMTAAKAAKFNDTRCLRISG
jgi:hypothetical protein